MTYHVPKNSKIWDIVRIYEYQKDSKVKFLDKIVAYNGKLELIDVPKGIF
jgi:hypothetical protein